MSNTQVLTLKIPMELKRRLERQARYQGTSVHRLMYYLLTTQLTEMETLEAINKRVSQKNIPDLKNKVNKILAKVPDKPVPGWDEM